MESYVVIGLGRFGTELATRLYACGEEVMVIDTDELLEVTPKTLRIRKRILDPTLRKREALKKKTE